MTNTSPFLGLRTVIYGVSDIQKAKTWYEAVLVMKPYFDQPYYVGFTVGGFELGLDPNAKQIVSGNTGVVAYWKVTDIGKEYDRIISLGGKEHTAIQDVGEGIKTATILDPFGNVLGLIYNPKDK